jgi:hypothetical protein
MPIAEDYPLRAAEHLRVATPNIKHFLSSPQIAVMCCELLHTGEMETER